MVKVLSTATYVLVITAVLAIAALFLISLVPIPGNVEVKIVQSGSMEPNIMTGSLVVIQPRPSYSIGEVITFGADTKDDVPTTHRIAKVTTEGGRTSFVTKGDANEEADTNPVQQSEVIGKVIYSLPYAGYVLDFAKKPVGFTLLIIIPAASIVLDELFVIFREVMKMRRKVKRPREGEYGAAEEELEEDPRLVETALARPRKYHIDLRENSSRSMYWDAHVPSMSGDIRPKIRI